MAETVTNLVAVSLRFPFLKLRGHQEPTSGLDPPGSRNVHRRKGSSPGLLGVSRGSFERARRALQDRLRGSRSSCEFLEIFWKFPRSTTAVPSISASRWGIKDRLSEAENSRETR